MFTSALHAVLSAGAVARSKRLSLALCAVALALAAGSSRAQAGSVPASIVEQCRADLASRIKVSKDNITLGAQKAVVWPDAALGMPRPGEAVAQVQTPGWSLYLKARHTNYLYTASKRAIRYGGPASMWGSMSLLCILPKHNDANLNGTLVQLSPVGSNPTTILDGVTSFYPQENGAIFATQRTSRSGFNLLYLAPGARDKAEVVASALDFGPVLLDREGTTWAAFIRPRLGDPLSLTIRSLTDRSSKGETFALPSGISGKELRWDGDTVVARVYAGDGTKQYLLLQQNGARVWKESPLTKYDMEKSILLNKSESLCVAPDTVDGKPAVRVYTMWFTGDVQNKTIIPGLQLEHIDLHEASRYVVVSGRMGDKPAVVVVDHVLGDTITLTGSEYAGARQWLAPTRSMPVLPASPVDRE